MSTVIEPAVARHPLNWMAPEAPYMPVASIGLLAALRGSDDHATLRWAPAADGLSRPVLTLDTRLGTDEVAAAVAEAPWPDVGQLAWPTKPSQAIKPSLASDSRPVELWRRLAGHDGEREREADTARNAAAQLVGALLTDGALDDKGLPGRSRLLRGVKADLSGVAGPPTAKPAELARELVGGPDWRSGSSGRGLGLVPEAQTFGGTTGPDPQSVGVYSSLLYRLCWLGVMEMPPYAVVRGPQRIVGGPLFADADTLSWPVWRMPLRRAALIAVFGLASIHADEPDRRDLRARGIDAVFRSHARAINTMVSVFGWGRRVA